MTPEIKQRIEQIRRGEMPEGYKKGKLGVVPEEWEETSFSTLFTSTSDYTDDLEKYPLYSLTIEDGITPKTERYERSHLVKKEDSYKIVRPNDYAYNPMNLRFGAVARHKGDMPVAVSGYYDIFTTVHESDLPFMDSFLTCGPMITYYNRVSTGSLVEKQRVHFSQFLEFMLPLPSINERTKIAAILATQDRVIELKEKRLAEKQRQKKYLMQQLLTGKKRLPGFLKSWKTVKLGEIFNYIQPTAYLVKTTDYDDSYKTPVLTAGKTFVLGYTNETEGVFTKVPVVIFDDFTTATKYVDFPFKVKSSAMKILTIKDGLSIVFAYEAMQLIKFTVGGHERHWISKYSCLTIDIPDIEEQTAIAEVLSATDREIDLLQQDIEQEKQKKKALMQLLLTGIVRVKT